MSWGMKFSNLLIFASVSLFDKYINLGRLFNAKAILVEEQ